jgi:ElaB/YqjD/DUF883 family membrane-anchored ribosome-binding protein
MVSPPGSRTVEVVRQGGIMESKFNGEIPPGVAPEAGRGTDTAYDPLNDVLTGAPAAPHQRLDEIAAVAKERLKEAAAAARVQLDRARHQAIIGTERAKRELATQLRENPMRVIGAATAVGFVVGLLIRSIENHRDEEDQHVARL